MNAEKQQGMEEDDDCEIEISKELLVHVLASGDKEASIELASIWYGSNKSSQEHLLQTLFTEFTVDSHETLLRWRVLLSQTLYTPDSAPATKCILDVVEEAFVHCFFSTMRMISTDNTINAYEFAAASLQYLNACESTSIGCYYLNKVYTELYNKAVDNHIKDVCDALNIIDAGAVEKLDACGEDDDEGKERFQFIRDVKKRLHYVLSFCKGCILQANALTGDDHLLDEKLGSDDLSLKFKPHQSVIQDILQTLFQRRMKRIGDSVADRIWIEGVQRPIYQKVCTIESYIYRWCELEPTLQRFSDLTLKPNTVHTVAKWLENTHNSRFPDAEESERAWAFNNGILGADGSDNFFPWEECISPVWEGGLVLKYFPVEYPAEELKSVEDPMDIPTPALDVIWDTQRLDRETQMWVMGFLGRLFSPLKSKDTWEAVLFFMGEAGTGKSIICNLVEALTSTARVNNTGLAAYQLAHTVHSNVIIFPEANRESTFAATTMLSLASAETIALEAKFKTTQTMTFRKPMLWAGNSIPKWDDDKNQVGRRVTLVTMDYPAAQGDTTLEKRVLHEIPYTVTKMIRCYSHLISLVGPRSLWDRGVICDFFRRSRTRLRGMLNSFYRFLADEDQCAIGPGFVCSLRDMISAYKMYCTDLSLEQRRVQLSSVRSTFLAHFGLKEEGGKAIINLKLVAYSS
jgi:hypothetical protein